MVFGWPSRKTSYLYLMYVSMASSIVSNELIYELNDWIHIHEVNLNVDIGSMYWTIELVYTIYLLYILDVNLYVDMVLWIERLSSYPQISIYIFTNSICISILIRCTNSYDFFLHVQIHVHRWLALHVVHASGLCLRDQRTIREIQRDSHISH